jgi:hypothetical protein
MPYLVWLTLHLLLLPLLQYESTNERVTLSGLVVEIEALTLLA